MRLFVRTAAFFFGIAIFYAPPSALAADYIGAACTTAGASACNLNGCFVCTGGKWTPQALIVGTGSACDANHAGQIQWSGTNLMVCNGTTWTAVGTSAGFTSCTIVSGIGTATCAAGYTLTGGGCSAANYGNAIYSSAPSGSAWICLVARYDWSLLDGPAYAICCH